MKLIIDIDENLLTRLYDPADDNETSLEGKDLVALETAVRGGIPCESKSDDNNDLISRKVLKKSVLGLLEAWADGYSYIEIPTEDGIKQMENVIDNVSAADFDKEIWNRSNELLDKRLAYLNIDDSSKQELKTCEHRPQGQWALAFGNQGEIYQITCDQCGYTKGCKGYIVFNKLPDYCEKCGAKMQTGGDANGEM